MAKISDEEKKKNTANFNAWRQQNSVLSPNTIQFGVQKEEEPTTGLAAALQQVQRQAQAQKQAQAQQVIENAARNYVAQPPKAPVQESSLNKTYSANDMAKGFNHAFYSGTNQAGYAAKSLLNFAGQLVDRIDGDYSLDAHSEKQKQLAQDYLERDQWLDERYGTPTTTLGRYADTVVSGAIGMSPLVAPYLIPGVGQVAGAAGTFLSSAGMGQGNALMEGASPEDAFNYALGSGALETGTNLLFGGTPFQKGIVKAGEKVAAKVGSEALKPVVEKGIDVLGEGVEEGIVSFADPYLQRATYNPDAENATAKEILWDAGVGVGTAAVMQGAVNLPRAVKNAPEKLPTAEKVQQKEQNKAFEALHGQKMAQNEQKIAPKMDDSVQKPQNAPEQEQDNVASNYITNTHKVAQNQSSKADFEPNPVENIQTENLHDINPKLERPQPTNSKMETVEAQNPTAEESSTVYGNDFNVNELPEEERAFFSELNQRFGGSAKLSKNLPDDVNGMLHNGEVILNANKLSEPDTIRFATVHEFGHKMKGTAEYDSIQEMALKYFRSIADDPEITDMDLVEYIKGTRQGTDYEIQSEVEAYDELTTMFMEMAFDDVTTIDKICVEQPSLAQRILEFIEQKIHDYNAKKGLSKLEKQQYDMLAKTRRLYVRGLRKTNHKVANYGETRYMFAGERSGTADREALTRAKQMESDGADMESIRRATGWFKSVVTGNKWVYEISDKGVKFSRNTPRDASEIEAMRIKEEMGKALSEGDFERFAELDKKLKEMPVNNAKRENVLGDYLYHPELYEAYPQLRDMPFVFDETIDADGQYDPTFKEIYINTDMGVLYPGGMPNNAKLDNVTNTMLHEIQHAIQHIEDIPNGASPEYWKRVLNDYYSTNSNMRNNLDLYLKDIGYPEFQQKQVQRVRNGEIDMDQYWKENEEFKNNSKHGKTIASLEKEIKEHEKNRSAYLTEYSPEVKRLAKEKNDIFRKFPYELQNLIRLQKSAAKEGNFDESSAYYDQIEEFLGKNPEYEELFDAYDEADWDLIDVKRGLDDKKPDDLYRNTAGEIMARDTKKRRNLDNEQRIKKQPEMGDKYTVYANGGRSYYIETEPSDKEYLDAVNRGDMETAQRMVDEAAKNAGYSERLYHQTGSVFSSFNTDNQVSGKYDYIMPTGIFLKPDDRDIGLRGKLQMGLYANIKNPLKFRDRIEMQYYWFEHLPNYENLFRQIEENDVEYKKLIDIAMDKVRQSRADFFDGKITEEDRTRIREEANAESDRLFAEWREANNELSLQMKGMIDNYMNSLDFDSVIVENDEGAFGRSTKAYIVFNPNQLKSADVATYDNEGNIIPLSQRFDAGNTDIRYSTGSSRYQQRVNEIKNIKHKREVSKVYSNTIKNSTLFTEAEKNIELNASEYEYDVKSEKESLHRATERLENDHAGTSKELMHKKMYTGEDLDAAMFLLRESIESGRETGNYNHAKAWLKKIQEAGTESGRMIQAYAKYSRTTAEGIAVQAERYVQQAEDSLKAGHAKGKIARKEIGKDKDSRKWQKVEGEVKKAQKAVEDAEVMASKSAQKELEMRVKAYKAKHYKTNPNPKAKPETDFADKLYKKVLEGTNLELEEKGAITGKQIVDELYQKLKENGMPDYRGQREKRNYTSLEYLKDAVQRKAEYAEVFEKTQEYMKAEYGNDPEVLQLINEALNGNFSTLKLDTLYSRKTLQGAMNEVASLYGVDFNKIISEKKGNKEAAKADIVNHILQFTKADANDADALADDIMTLYDELLAEKTERRIKQLEPRAEADIKKLENSAVKKLAELFNLGAYNDERAADYKGENLNKSVKQTAEILDIDLKRIIKESNGDKQAVADTISEYIRENADLDKAETDKLAEDVVQTYYAELQRLTDQRLKQLFPELVQPQLKKASKKKTTWFEDVMELINLGAYDNQDIVDIIKQKNDLPVLTSADIETIYSEVEKANQYKKYSYEWKIHMAKAQQVAADKMPQSMKNKVTQLKRIMMLSNPRTDVRNLAGNMPLTGTEMMSNAIAATIDKVMSEKRGTQRTISAKPELGAFAQGFAKGFGETVSDIKQGVNTYRMGEESTTQYEMPRGRTFDNAFLNGIDKAVNYGLMFGDRPFFEGHYNKRMAELERLGYDITSEEAKADAYGHAVDMVFQSDSDMAKGASGIREALNNILTVGDKFALGDFVVPFVQTPANIADKLLDYSPVGLARAVGQLGKSNTEAFDQKLFSQRLGRSLTGMGILAVSYALAEAGILTGSSDDDPEKRRAMEVSGWKPYSIKIGNTYYDYSFIQPVGMLMAIGADMYKEGQSVDDLTDLVAVSGAGIKGGVNCFFNMSFFSSLTDFFGGYGDAASNMGKAVLDFPTQFAPAITNAVNKTIDPYQRETYDPNPLKQTMNKMAAKLPLASQTLPIKQNVYGEDMMQNQGRNAVQRTAENMLFPSTVGQTKSHKVNDELLRLNEATGSKSQFFAYPDKRQDFGGETVVLSSDEWLNFIENSNGYASRQAENLIGSSFYKEMSDEDKVDAISTVKKYANYKAKKALASERGLSYKGSADMVKMDKAVKVMNGNVVAYMKMKADTAEIKANTSEDKAEIKKYLKRLKDGGTLTDEQYWYMRYDLIEGGFNETEKRACPYTWIKQL